ncbi:CAP-Gly domain-containing linker protein 1 [Trichonephila clavipes]|uniref:CAP-Gly domain-containing linker protein 1 n=1 Tax=Trichonephila clavipes TaxID=2585209 RepID=A0A8X6S1Y5_TRICX|nr:CAP-Gly domain-containing linker protein 1 [Trichonephila clavipes]
MHEQLDDKLFLKDFPLNSNVIRGTLQQPHRREIMAGVCSSIPDAIKGPSSDEIRGRQPMACVPHENGYVDIMETRLRCGSVRQKSKVPRACCSQRSDYVDCTPNNGSLRKESPMSGSSSIQSSDTDEHKEWQRLVGERVCISGVKQGILRYFGRTNFAQGYWCGVELDEPVGKNNGTVNGVIYFNCKPNHGIFAPVSKVSKLNDLSSCNWQIDTREIMAAAQQHEARYRHPHWDYNLGLLADTESSETKYIKNSISDPSFLRATMRATMPRCSESFPYDKRSFVEQQEAVPVNFRNVRNFEMLDGSSRRSKSQSSSVTTVVKNSSSRSLGKFRYNKKNPYLSSNGGYFEDSGSESLREKHASLRSAVTGLQNPSLMAEEYEQFLRTPTNSGEVSPLSSEAKRFNEMPLYDYGKMPDTFLNAFQSHDLSDFEDDTEDHMSVDYDESLGILTPSQMKDLTLGPDFPTSLSDIRGMDFPSSESFDDINDLPEDEQVHDVSVYRVSESSAVRNVEVSKPNNLGNYNSKSYSVSSEDKVHVSSTDKFLYSISQKDHDSYALETCFSSSSVEDFGLSYKINNLSAATTVCNDQHKIKNVEKERYFDEKSFSKTSSGEPTLNTNIRLIQNNTLIATGAPFSESDASSLGDQNKTEVDQNISTYHCRDDGGKAKSNTLKSSAKEEICRKNYDTDDSRDSLQTESEGNTTMKEKLTVSWEDCLSHNNDCMYSHVERPDSVYTVGSSDTGFQEDGELEGMTTSLDSSDGNKRFSTTSRDSCIVADEVDVYKIAESNSTSGYSTGLSDSCCNDRVEDDSSSKPLTDEEIQDSVGPCDSEDAFSFQESNSLSKDPEIMTIESEITTEAVTALCNNDSTSDALCETMVEDSTLTEIHDLLLSPEENRSPSSVEAKEMPVDPPKEPADDTKTTEKKESDSSPARSTPEKKPTQTKSKVDVSRTGANRTSRMCDEESDKKKQMTKSPKKNVMSKIKAMIEATSCKAAPKTKPEAIEQVSRRAISVPKKSRWEAVTSKIAASLAEEKTKPKTKREIKSRVDTNLITARQQVTVCKSPKLDSSRLSNCDGSMSPISVSSRDRRPLTERNSTTSSLREARVKLSRDSKQRPKSPRPSGKACITSRSASPVAASESSSTSLTSHSKIAQWKGSTSTVASSAPPPPVIGSAKRPPPVVSNAKATVPSARTTARVPNKKPPVPKIRVSAPPSSRMRSPSPAVSKTKQTKTTKGHTGVVVPLKICIVERLMHDSKNLTLVGCGNLGSEMPAQLSKLRGPSPVCGFLVRRNEYMNAQ